MSEFLSSAQAPLLDSAVRKLAEAREECTELRAQIDAVQAERDQYQRSYETAKSLLETSEQREDALRAWCERLMTEVDDLDRHLADKLVVPA
jgi:chromosome segregation ATPase